MRKLARPLLRLLGRDDRGVIGVLVGVLITGGVLLGIGALVVDVGQIYQNRAELQNGADAAALAIAKQCATGQGTCPATTSGTAQTFTNLNASALTGHTNGVVAVCGSGDLNPCSDYPGIFGSGLTACPPDPTDLPAGSGFVDVATSTKLASGSTLLPPVFARTLIGNSTYDGTNVKACAQAEWGAQQYGGSIAVTISGCEWALATGGSYDPTTNVFTPGDHYWPNYSAADQSTWPQAAPAPDTDGGPAVADTDGSDGADAAYDQSLIFHSGNNVTSGSCPVDPASADAPGAFGWTSDPNNTCQVVISQSTYGPSTGDSIDSGCQTVLTNAYLNHTALLMPVYNAVVPQGNNTVYTLAGFASFVVTGFRGPSISEPDWLNPDKLCNSSQTCIDGFFTTNTLCTTDCQPGGTYMGSFYTKLTG